MEIRSVVKKIENEYPKMEQISKKHLLKSIPNKWLKVGLSSLGIVMITRNNAFANTIIPVETTLSGDVSVNVEKPLAVQICNYSCPIVEIVSAILIIITGLVILITKMKTKKEDEPQKVKKWIIIIFIISIIVFIISILTNFIINNC